MSLNELAAAYLSDSERWFPELHESRHQAAVHFALGLAGEVGEVVNLIKKVNRGSTNYSDVHVALGHEIADVFAYAFDLAAVLGVDIDTALVEKRAICEERWGVPAR